jgi:formamidase
MMAVHEIRVDPTRPLREQPQIGHNRWHPDIAPVVRCEPGDEVVFETLDALDGQCTPDTTNEGVAAIDLSMVHPLTGPVHVAGAEPGDTLEVEILEMIPDSYGFTVQVPGFGFLRDYFPEPYVVHWELAGGWAASEQLPGVRVPAAPFLGTIGLPPGAASLRRTIEREQRALDAGGMVLPPSVDGAVPTDPAIAGSALRTVPPREQGGNVDIKQLTAGTRLFPARGHPGCVVLRRRRPLCPGRWRGVRHRDRDAHHGPGTVHRPLRVVDYRAAVLPYGLLGGSRIRGPAALLRHHRTLG